MPEHMTVQPPLRYVPPRFNPPLFRFVTAIYPLYIRLALNIRRVDVEGIETLLEHYRLFQEKRIRLIIAFRHPHLDDGALMARLLANAVQQASRAAQRRRDGRALSRRPFAYFVYDRGAPLWAGPFIGWLLPRMGGVSVFRGKLDSHAIEEIRSVLLNADQPLAIAPEGAVSYNERHSAPLETGVAHFAFWCVRDLLATKRSESVVILPLVPSYHHGNDAAEGLHRIASFLERELGLPQPSGRPITSRLRVAAQSLFRTAELFYKRFYPLTSSVIPEPDPVAAASAERDGADGHFRLPERERIGALVEAALSSAERTVGLPSSGEPIPRVRRLEQACWDRIYREDIADLAALAPLERSLADRIAAETSLTMRHLQLADIIVYLNELALPDDAPIDELAEAASNLAGVLARLKGGDISATPRIGSRTVTYRVGAPLSVSGRWEAYQTNRQGAVDELMEALHGEFVRLSSMR